MSGQTDGARGPFTGRLATAVTLGRTAKLVELLDDAVLALRRAQVNATAPRGDLDAELVDDIERLVERAVKVRDQALVECRLAMRQRGEHL